MLDQVIKVTKRSIGKFQFGDSEPVIVLDVIEVADSWHDVNFALRELKDDMWVLPAGKTNEHAVNRMNLVQAYINDAYAKQCPDKQPPTISRAEAEEFIRLVQKEAEELRNFIYPKDVETSSVPESSAPPTGTNFSQ